MVTGQDALAQAFPTPEVDVDPTTIDIIEQPLAIDIPSGTDSVQILLRNTGGVYLPTGVLLNWEIGSTPSFVSSATGPNGQPFGSFTATRQSTLITVQLNRDGPVGAYSEPLFIGYDTGTLGYGGAAEITLRTTIGVPNLEVETSGPGNSIDFGDTFDTATMLVRNAGQSTLVWSIDTTGLPSWITVLPITGQAGAGVEQVVTVLVDRTGLAPGNFSTSFPVNGFGETEVITVEMVVP